MASDNWLVRELLDQRKKIEALSRGGTGVGHTSLAANESLTVNTENGEVVLKDGGLDYVSGVVPPVPTAPTLKLGFGTIEVTWDGSFGEDSDGLPIEVPLDFDAVEVHASTDPEEEEWGDDTYKGQIKTREGGTVTTGGYDVDDEVYVCLIALAKTGLRSDPSTTSMLTIEGLDFSTLFNELDAANATIKNAGEILVTEQGTLDEKLTEVDGTLNDLGQDLQAVEDAQEQLNTDLTDVMTSVDGKNTITWNPAAPTSATPGKAVGDMWYRTSSNSIIGFWKWDGSAWVTQLLDKTTIPLIDVGAGTFGSLSGGRLAAHSITSDRVIIGSGGNVVPWGQITAGSTYSPHEPYGPTGSTASLTPADSAKGLPAHLTVTRTSSGSWASIMSFWAAPGQKLPVDEGTEYVFTVRVYSANVSQARLSLFAYNHGGSSTANNSGVIASSSGTALSENVSEITVRGRVPAGVGYCLPYLQSSAAGAVGVVSVDLRKAVGTTLIEDGAVSTQKLTADVLEVKNLKATSGQLNEAVINKLFSDVVVAKTAVAEAFIGENAILTGAVTTPKLVANAVTADKIAANAITAAKIDANAINGMVITGATVRSAASGARVQMSASGLEVFDQSNSRTFYADASTGNLSIVGDFYTNKSGTERVNLSNGLWSSVEVIDPNTGGTYLTGGAGARIGVSANSGIDVYHAARTVSNGVFVDAGSIRGPYGLSRTDYGYVPSQSDQSQTNYVESQVYDSNQTMAAKISATTAGIGSSGRRASLSGFNTSGKNTAHIAAYGQNGAATMEAIDGSGKIGGQVYASSTGRRAGVFGYDDTGNIASFVEAYGTGRTTATGTNIRPFDVTYNGSGDSWLVPFIKGTTEWGYVGSTGAMGVDEFGIQSASGKTLVLSAAGSATSMKFDAGGNIYMDNTPGLRWQGMPTGSGSNIQLTSQNYFVRNTSSRRYKTNIMEADKQPGILDMKPVLFQYREHVEALGKSEEDRTDFEREMLSGGVPVNYGLIAEDLHDAGLTHLVNYDDGGEPDGVFYDKIGVSLIPVVGEMAETVRDLLERINELESRNK